MSWLKSIIVSQKAIEIAQMIEKVKRKNIKLHYNGGM